MRFEKSVVPIAVLASLGSSLVIPELSERSKMPCHSKGKHSMEKLPAEKETSREERFGDGEKHKSVGKLKFQEAPFPLAPMVMSGSASDKILPHRYIVVLKKGASREEIDFHKELISEVQLQSARQLDDSDPFFVSTADAENCGVTTGGIQDSFDIAGLLNGYVGYFTDAVVDLIRLSPLVEFVERDSMVHASEFDTQNGAPWGLSRISHRERLNLGSFNKYLYDDEGGKGVTSYVIDTGINVDHKDFGGRAKWGKTVPLNDEDVDGNGHGTHCAGTIASKHYGVAKAAKVVAVKVLRSNGSGSMSDVIKGVEFATQSHQKDAKEKKKGFKGSTANMSLGGGKSPALDMAVNAAVKAGIHFAVAAGNENQDACNTSPAAAENAITVGASTLSDDRAYFSNWGKCVDIFAPGLNILSTYIGSDDATATLSGTSMASPHVAGLLTYFLSLQPDSDSDFFTAGSGVTPEQLKKKLIAYSTNDILYDLPEGTPNALIYNGGGHDLKGFWGGKDKEVASPQPNNRFQDFDLQDMVDNLGSKTDALFDQVRNVLDKLNII
ncbi:hypothetical protein HG537_0G04700 [Torulaspora globosa]|uniref:Peptidase S8/S53 domain-containing protein n=1 Tax=Torulaspora globosa TaxID=48254 RepID=A0A7H9I031_9SACH|nr:hypothetical protein HG537_0G04700 [Torulaspora sp. CBS 2947]